DTHGARVLEITGHRFTINRTLGRPCLTARLGVGASFVRPVFGCEGRNVLGAAACVQAAHDRQASERQPWRLGRAKGKRRLHGQRSSWTTAEVEDATLPSSILPVRRTRKRSSSPTSPSASATESAAMRTAPCCITN